MKVTLGGDRVGSGNKMKQYLHNYERSTHNLSQKFTSSMGVGMLIPFLCELVTRDDKYEIDLSAGLRTIPTKGPLFGSFKLQLDVYQCPMRLYQALLHNNPLAIGLKANQVKFPKIRLYGSPNTKEENKIAEIMSATNSLVKYLGISGIGSAKEGGVYQRDVLAIPTLAYYDIFKNYYANKQEENAYTIGTETTTEKVKTTISSYSLSGSIRIVEQENEIDCYLVWAATSDCVIAVRLEKENNEKITLKEITDNLQLEIQTENYDTTGKLDELIEEGMVKGYQYHPETQILDITFPKNYNNENIEIISIFKLNIKESIINLKPFAIKNIDDMRMNILSYHQMGRSYTIDCEDEGSSPYYEAIGDATDTFWQKPLSGICVKTYQSDMYNNWLQTEWIDGENGISAITAISTSEGKITVDALQFSEKLYNLLNRIAVAGNTYEDYLDAAYTQSHKRFCESPMWIGGLSDEIVFEEIVQTAPAEGDPLGSLGGRGNLLGKKKGGKITVKIDEPSFIIGIVSITPRIVYTQDNRFYNTEIDSLADIHVPALDGIAFQNLIGERLHAASTLWNEDTEQWERPTIGKQPAWLEYMSAVDRAYGDFAQTDGKGYMVLQRDYLVEDGELKDATTYIDPAKFNYAFAYTERDAQNFWVQIYSNIKARRLMSAKQIPTA